MKVLHVVGARPNFMKIAPVMHEMSKDPAGFQQVLVHTGQHYDANMSQVFFDELGLPRPDINLHVGSASHAAQTARIMEAFEPVLLQERPDWVLVPGDVNSTLACALVSAKLGYRVAHLEAGLRSFDRSMPEEINRVLTDQISYLLFTTERDAGGNLLREGVEQSSIHFVGNVMIDTLVRLLPQAEARWPHLCDVYDLDRYTLVTVHRPSNVDDADGRREIVQALNDISKRIPIVFPMHPRTLQRFEQDPSLPTLASQVHVIDPLGYLDFLALQRHAALVITDSGGVQEETTYLGVPCLTVRPNTERPITIEQGTNRLVETEHGAIVRAAEEALATDARDRKGPEMWDGRAAERVVDVLRRAGA